MARDSDLKKENSHLKKALDESLQEIHLLQTARNKDTANLVEMYTNHHQEMSRVETDVNNHLDDVHESNNKDKEEAVALAKDEQHSLNMDTITSLIKGSASSATPKVELPTVSDFIATFVNEKSGNWGAKTQADYLNSIGLFIKILGNKRLSDYERKDFLNYIGTLELVHNSYGKSIYDKKHTVTETLKVAEEKEKMTITTLTKHFNTIKMFFRTANQNADSTAKCII